MSASLESVGLADVRLMVKLMCLLAGGRVPKFCPTVDPGSRVILASMPAVSFSTYRTRSSSFVRRQEK